MPESGDIVWLEFPGAVVTKRRPAVILSSAQYHQSRPDYILGLITSQTDRLGPTDYLLRKWAEAGLRLPSAFRAYIITIPKTSVILRMGRLSPDDWQQVLECVQEAFANFAAPSAAQNGGK